MAKKSVQTRRQAQPQRGAPPSRGGSGRGQPRRRPGRGQGGRPWGLISAIVGVVAAFIVIILVLELSSGPASQDTSVNLAPASIVSAVTKIPQHTMESAGAGNVTYGPQALPASSLKKAGLPATLTSNGKPQVLYVGAEYCPYCALERWGLIMALAKFGTFSNLHTIRSSVTDSPSNIATFTFVGSTYTSPYVDFQAKELQSNVANGSGFYKSLQKLSKAQAKVFNGLDPGGYYPFVDYGNKWVQVGSPVATATEQKTLQGLNWQQIADQLGNPSSGPAKDILGVANYNVAAICSITGNKPAAVCSSSTIRSLESKL